MPVKMNVPPVSGPAPHDPMTGRPVAAHVAPATVVVPDPPNYGDDDPTMRDEQQVVRTEILMTKGIRDRRQLMALLEVRDQRTMDRYIKRVYARWEQLGSSRDLTRHRGEGLNRLDLVESEAWAQVSNAEHPMVKLAGLKLVSEVHRQRLELLGLTPKVIADMNNSAGDNIKFSQRVASHETLSRVASRMLAMIDGARPSAGSTRLPPPEPANVTPARTG